MKSQNSTEHFPCCLVPHHVFGVKTDVKGGLSFLEDNQIFYIAGHYAVLYTIDVKIQKFFPAALTAEAVTCVAMSPSRRYAAVSEKGPCSSSINIYDIVAQKRRRALNLPEEYRGRVISTSFSSESKYLLALVGSPDWMLLYWAWDKAKLLASVHIPHAQGSWECSVNPTDSAIVIAMGNGAFKAYRLQDCCFRPVVTNSMKRELQQNFATHLWLADERLLLGTTTGELLLFDSALEFKMVLPGSPGTPNSVTSMGGFSKGFVIGGDNGTFVLYEKSSEPKEVFRKVSSVTVDGSYGATAVTIAVAPSEELIGAVLSNGQMISLCFSDETELLRRDGLPAIDFLVAPFHTGKILGMSLCVRKPLVATCGTDKSVRIWNCIDKTCELTKQFTEEAFSVAFHPTGLFLLVGLAEKLRLMTVLIEDLQTAKELPIKACRECCFCNGGHFFAAANVNTIQVYKTYTCEMTASLRGHNSKVCSICWSLDDSTLTSTGMDGAVYEFYVLLDGRRISDFVQKGTSFSCVISYTDPSSNRHSTVPTASTTTFSAAATANSNNHTAIVSGNTFYVVGTDKLIKEISASQASQSIITGKQLGQLALAASSHTMFAGIAELEQPGHIRAYPFPLKDTYTEYACHSGICTRLAASFDETFLISAAEDGSLFVFDIRDCNGAAREKEIFLPYADEILVTRGYLEEREACVGELERKVEELMNQIDFQLRSKDAEYKDTLGDAEKKYETELEKERMKYELIREEKQDLEAETEDAVKNLEEENLKKIQVLEMSFQSKMSIEILRYQKLSAERDRELKAWDNKMNSVAREYEKRISATEEEAGRKRGDVSEELRQIIEEKELAARTHQEALRQLEEDADAEMDSMKESYEVKLTEERDEKVRLRGQTGIHRKNFEDLKKELDANLEELRHKDDLIASLRADIEKLHKERDGLVREIKERDKTIGDKEQRIYDLKKKTQELEKFKFVLDYKIKELKSQIDPKNDDIAEMKRQIHAMDSELEDYHKKNKQLGLDISQLQMKQKALQDEVTAHRKKLADSRHIVKRFRDDLYDCAQYIQQPKDLKDYVATLYRKYVDEDVKKTELDLDIQREYNRQRDHLEKSVESLKRKLAKDSQVHRQDNMNIMQENVSLIREINTLRRELNYFRHERQQAKINSGKKSVQLQPPRILEQRKSSSGSLMTKSVGALSGKTGFSSTLTDATDDYAGEVLENAITARCHSPHGNDATKRHLQQHLSSKVSLSGASPSSFETESDCVNDVQRCAVKFDSNLLD